MNPKSLAEPEREAFINAVARRNVTRVAAKMVRDSAALDILVRERRIAIVSAMYDVVTGNIEFIEDTPAGVRATG
jgi:carbonic anhydrase/SulP family sulfate permease